MVLKIVRKYWSRSPPVGKAVDKISHSAGRQLIAGAVE